MMAVACMLGATESGFGADDWHEFKSATDGKTFTGKVVGYDPETKSVTMERKGSTAQIRFTVDKLSPEDQEYVAEVGRRMEVARYIHVKFDKIQNAAPKITTSPGNSKITTTRYQAGYQIELGNFGPAALNDITVDYLLVWNKDPSVDFRSADLSKGEKTEPGSEKVTSIVKGGKTVLTTRMIDLVSVDKKVIPRTEKIGGIVREVPTTEKSGRSKDTLEGCVVWIKVGGKVVKSVASSPPLLEKYKDATVPGENGAGK